MGEKIGAIILTRNRRKMLTECLDSLLKEKKISKLIIVINGTEDDTLNYLTKNYQDRRIILIEQENLGSAGGFSRGLIEAHKNKLDWVWLFDDDCEPMKNALNNLMKARDLLIKNSVNVGFLAPRQFLLDGLSFPVLFDFKNKNFLEYFLNSLIPLRWTVFTGLFLNMKAVEEVGLPKKEFFLYEDDTDFTYRIRRNYSCYLVGNSNILHKDYMKNRKGYLPLVLSKKSFRNCLFGIRNGIYFSRLLFKENKKEGIIQFLGLNKNIVFPLLFSKRFYSFPLVFLWFIKGFLFNPKTEFFN
jgi:GT2 family glycosyltransferase